MRDFTILKANLKRHRSLLTGIGILMLIAAASLAVTLTMRINAKAYVTGEMQRLGYGDLTVWVSGMKEGPAPLVRAIAKVNSVASAKAQQIIFASYTISGHESDSEGQLITHNPETYPYRFFSNDLSGYARPPETIAPGDIYVPASLISMFKAGIGDTIEFVAARNGVMFPFVIRGFFEDPFMGSTMIGMKSFLIGQADHQKIVAIVSKAGINALARDGAMIHIAKNPKDTVTVSGLNSRLNLGTDLSKHTEFTHSREVLAGFMLLLTNIFTGLLLAFVLILLVTAFIVTGHSIGGSIEQDTVNLGILKTVGYTGARLRRLQVLQFLVPIVCGSTLGLVLSPALAGLASHMTLTTAGVLVPWHMPLAATLFSVLVILLALFLFVRRRTARVTKIPPARAVSKGAAAYRGKIFPALGKSGLSLRMALRQLFSAKKLYLSSLLIALLLVLSTSLIGRMNAWLGPNGEGLMDAFNPADVDLGVQIFSDLDPKEVEAVINQFSPITDRYDLAMPNISLNGVDYSANVITDPARLHILSGETCTGAGGVVLTEFLAADLGIHIGDEVTLSAERGAQKFVVTGFYQCANDMGANLGLSREGFLRIARDDPRIWCAHYFLKDPGTAKPAMEKLASLYRADIHVHENAWPGLYGIISAMRSLMIFMYAVAAVVILTAVWLSGSKILHREQRDLCIYRALGFSALSLRSSFTCRFCLVSAAGAAAGSVLSAIFTDFLVDQVMRYAGISGFSSHPGPAAVLLPVLTVVGLFSLSAFLVSRRIARVDLNMLAQE